MITIEEKLNLFTRIVYDKIEKENKEAVNKFNKECGSTINEKTQEFTNQAQLLERQIEREANKEKLQIISRARIKEKKIMVGKNNDIFNDAVQKVLEYAKGYTETKEYGDMLKNDIAIAVKELGSKDSLAVYLTSKDKEKYGQSIHDIFQGSNIELISDDMLVGGFIIIDNTKNLKIDMSFTDRINSSREHIGERLFEILQ